MDSFKRLERDGLAYGVSGPVGGLAISGSSRRGLISAGLCSCERRAPSWWVTSVQFMLLVDGSLKYNSAGFTKVHELEE